MKHRTLVRVSKVRIESLPFSPATYYKWHHTHKYPELFVKIGGALFVDTKALEKIIEAGRQK